MYLQVNLFQKLPTSAEHVVYQNCSECQNKTKTTIWVHNMFCRYSELTIFMNNEQSVVILWVSWCKNKSFWQRFTCTIIFRLLGARNEFAITPVILLFLLLPAQRDRRSPQRRFYANRYRGKYWFQHEFELSWHTFTYLK